jgi:hypothetical protein
MSTPSHGRLEMEELRDESFRGCLVYEFESSDLETGHCSMRAAAGST